MASRTVVGLRCDVLVGFKDRRAWARKTPGPSNVGRATASGEGEAQVGEGVGRGQLSRPGNAVRASGEGVRGDRRRARARARARASASGAGRGRGRGRRCRGLATQVGLGRRAWATWQRRLGEGVGRGRGAGRRGRRATAAASRARARARARVTIQTRELRLGVESRVREDADYGGLFPYVGLERNVNFISEILYFSIFYFAPFDIPVYILFSIVNLHQESFSVFFFNLYSSTSYYSYGWIRTSGGGERPQKKSHRSYFCSF